MILERVKRPKARSRSYRVDGPGHTYYVRANDSRQAIRLVLEVCDQDDLRAIGPVRGPTDVVVMTQGEPVTVCEALRSDSGPGVVADLVRDG